MKKDESFKDFVIDQLKDLEGMRSRHMFGGWGLYKGSNFFGIISNGRLYFKTNDKTKSDYIDAGMKQFSPTPKMTLKTYYEVPPNVIEDADELVIWATTAANV
jgi:DNA transformation protein